MSASFENTAAWQTEANVKPLKVGPGPDQSNPEADEVVIKVASVAINPSEWKVTNLQPTLVFGLCFGSYH